MVYPVFKVFIVNIYHIYFSIMPKKASVYDIKRLWMKLEIRFDTMNSQGKDLKKGLNLEWDKSKRKLELKDFINTKIHIIQC